MEFKTIRALFDIEGNAFGFSEKEILKAEDKLNISFPATLRSYYHQLGRHQKLNRFQNFLINLEQLAIAESGVLVFYIENQGVASWGIKNSDLEKPNPKVYRKEETEWVLDSDSLSTFLNSMAFMQAVFALDYHANVIGVDKKYDDFVTANFAEIEGGVPLWDVKFYRNKPSELITVFRSEGQIDIFISAKTKDVFEEFTSRFDLAWEE